MSWSINGRFLTQPQTGVQRYATEMVKAIDKNMGKLSFEVLAPRPTQSHTPFVNIAVRSIGSVRGHVWEQAILPNSMAEHLLSLCNTGPIVTSQQIVCIHDANVWDFSNSYSLAFRIFYKTILPILGRRALKILTVSRASADALIAHGVAQAKNIEVISNGHEHVFGWDPARSIFSKPQNVESRPFVFALGSRAPHKNLNLLLKIATKLDEMGLDLYVSGASLSIFSSGITLQVPKNVRMLGYVSDDDLAALYMRAVCLAFPSFVEGFGIPLVEAMAFGCPIMSSNTSCMPEICGSYASYASPFDAEAWVRGISRIYGEGRVVGPSAPSLSKYSWSKSGNELVKLCAVY